MTKYTIHSELADSTFVEAPIMTLTNKAEAIRLAKLIANDRSFDVATILVIQDDFMSVAVIPMKHCDERDAA